jgi:hypothetical protein
VNKRKDYPVSSVGDPVLVSQKLYKKYRGLLAEAGQGN